MKEDYKECAAKSRMSIFSYTEHAFSPRPKNKREIAYGTLDQSSLNISINRPNHMSNAREFKLQELAMLSITPIVRNIQNWWLQRAERHYLICADVELQRAREAQLNVAYYQKRAALARSARH